jgi:hypothetical protein
MVRRSVTNTPLQALILMNDPTYVEAARKFAERILKEGGTSVAQRLNFAYRVALSRSVKPKEAPILSKVLSAQLIRFRKLPKEAESLLQIGESVRDAKWNASELAAWTLVASLILNLDEAITKG